MSIYFTDRPQSLSCEAAELSEEFYECASVIGCQRRYSNEWGSLLWGRQWPVLQVENCHSIVSQQPIQGPGTQGGPSVNVTNCSAPAIHWNTFNNFTALLNTQCSRLSLGSWHDSNHILMTQNKQLLSVVSVSGTPGLTHLLAELTLPASPRQWELTSTATGGHSNNTDNYSRSTLLTPMILGKKEIWAKLTESNIHCWPLFDSDEITVHMFEEGLTEVLILLQMHCIAVLMHICILMNDNDV